MKTSQSKPATSRKSKQAQATNDQPADYVLSGPIAEKFSALAEKHGVTPEELVRIAVKRHCDQLESALTDAEATRVPLSKRSAERLAYIAKETGRSEEELADIAIAAFLDKNDPGTTPEPVKLSARAEVEFTPEQIAGLRSVGEDPAAVMDRHVARARESVKAYANFFSELPETPTLERFTTQDCYSWEYQLSRPGLFLPLPGIVADLEIPQPTALRKLAWTLFEFEADLRQLCVEKFDSIKKQTADALLLAELIIAREDRRAVLEGRDDLTDGQLFCLWASSGEPFELFQRALTEKEAYEKAKLARDEVARAAAPKGEAA